MKLKNDVIMLVAGSVGLVISLIWYIAGKSLKGGLSLLFKGGLSGMRELEVNERFAVFCFIILLVLSITFTIYGVVKLIRSSSAN